MPLFETRTATGTKLFSLLTGFHDYVYIAKYLFSIRDD